MSSRVILQAPRATMSRILQVIGIVLMCQIFVECRKEYYSPDETVHQNLKNVDPISYLLPFKTINSDQEYLRASDTARSTGPVHTFVKTDKNANFKWGVRHFVGKKYAK